MEPFRTVTDLSVESRASRSFGSSAQKGKTKFGDLYELTVKILYDTIKKRCEYVFTTGATV